MCKLWETRGPEPLSDGAWWGSLLLLMALFSACGGSGGGTSQSVTAPSSVPSNGPSGVPSGVVYNLDIRLGPGVTESPAESGSVASGTVVNYTFIGVDPLANVRVLLDKNVAPASGHVTMDRAHLFESAVEHQPGSHAPAFSGVTSDGRTVRLSDYRGKYVFVDFSEVFCPGSVNEASYLQNHLDAWKARGMEIVTVLVFNATGAPTTVSDLRAWQTNYKLSLPVISDPGHATDIYNSDALLSHTDFPSGYIIDPAGVIRYRFSGFDGPTIDAAVAALFH